MTARPGDSDTAMLKPMRRHEHARHGPYVVTCSETTTHAVSAQGREVLIRAMATDFHTEIKHELSDGIDVLIDGAVVGQLIQKEHGFWRRDRGIDFVPTDPTTFPPSPFFRLRRSVKVVCENDDGELIGPPWFRPLGGGRLNVAAGVGDDLLLVYAAAAFGLLGVMKL